MHIESALITTGVAVAAYAISTGANVFAGIKSKKSSNCETLTINKTSEENKTVSIVKKPLFIGIMAALVFSLQMMNVSIVGTGSSGHFVGAILLAFLFGPYVSLLAMSSILTVQCLLFADGGLLALGCNIFNMGIIPCLIVYPLISMLFAKVSNDTARKLLIVGISSYLSVIIGAFMVSVETLGVAAIPFSAFLAQMLSIHSIIGLVEVAFTLAVVGLISVITTSKSFESNRSITLYASMAVLTLVCGVILSQFASAFPDGLEWSVANVSNTIATSPVDLFLAKYAFLPGYAFKNSESIIGTSISGLVGSVVVFGIMSLATLRNKKNLSLAK